MQNQLMQPALLLFFCELCRGSYLCFTGSRAFQQIMNTKHTFLHRHAVASAWQYSRPLGPSATSAAVSANCRGRWHVPRMLAVTSLCPACCGVCPLFWLLQAGGNCTGRVRASDG